MSSANGFKAQYKTTPGSVWSTKLSGTEHSCLLEKTRLEARYKYVRVIDSDGRVVA